MSVFHFHCHAHLGDNIMNLRYFLYLTKFLKERNYKIYYYYNNNYYYNRKEALLQYVDTDIVELKPVCETPRESVDLWIGSKSRNGFTHGQIERYYEEMYKEISKTLHIENLPLNNSVWFEEPFLLQVYDNLDPKFKDIDIFILNNIGMSGQFNDNRQLNDLARYLNTKFNVVTVVDIGIKSAAALSLKEIGAISTRSKYIITPNSAPCCACLNSYAKGYVRKWFFVGGVHGFYSINHMQCGFDVTPIKVFFDSINPTDL